MASPQFSHRLEHVFAQPEAYNPDRFAPGQEVDKGLPFSYIAFGGGRHGCMGTTFAYLQVLCCDATTCHVSSVLKGPECVTFED